MAANDGAWLPFYTEQKCCLLAGLVNVCDCPSQLSVYPRYHSFLVWVNKSLGHPQTNLLTAYGHLLLLFGAS